MRQRPLPAVFALWAAFLAGDAFADSLVGKVVGISDGDTVTLLTEEHRQSRIRVAGIDAPEKGQPFGKASKESLSDCAFGKQVKIEWKKVDRYGRTVGKMTVDGLDCGLRQIELGHAWHYKAYAREQAPEDRQAYAEAETAAKAARKGLWAEDRPTPPWDYRHPSHNEASP